MARSLPPLNSVRAFEAAARHLSFTRAAEELHVTPAAISHHIRLLEQRLGFPLFVRLTRKLVLTPQGKALLPVVATCFDQIAKAIDDLRREAARPHLSLRMPPYLSAWWLTPRLAGFVQRHPDVELHLEHSVEPVDFSTGQVDLAVHWTGLRAPGVTSEPLLATPRVPMCSRLLLEGGAQLNCPDDLRHFTLLHEFDYGDWEQWFLANGMDPREARHGIVVDNYEVLFRATIEGQGLALLMSSIFSDQIATNDLVAPLGEEPSCQFVYYVLYPRGALARTMVREFRQWLLEEAHRT